MSDLTLAIVLGVVVVVFVVLWRQGHLLRFANYVGETREELRKCTWPTRDELKGSTVVVAISVLLLGLFTVAVDAIIAIFVKLLTA